MMGDKRYSGSMDRELYVKAFDESAMTLAVEFENDEGEVTTYTLPAMYEVCPTCDGKGTHVNPAIDDNGISAQEFIEDPDFQEAYFYGAYDVACYECQSKRVVPRVDADRADKAALKAWELHLKSEYEYRSMCEAERRFGC